MKAPDMIELRRISKIFNQGRPNAFEALKPTDLTIEGGCATAIVGPSGSGKTTLLSILGCMLRPTTGRVFVHGREVTSLPERFTAGMRRDTFGFVFQNYHLIKGLSVLDNVMIPAFPDGGPFRDLKERSLVLLERLEIGDKAGRPVEQLSGGEQQRTALARALINDPAVVVADEPTAHLDSRLTDAFIAMTAALKSEGKTILIATHDERVYRSPGIDRTVEMRDGRVVADRGKGGGQ